MVVGPSRGRLNAPKVMQRSRSTTTSTGTTTGWKRPSTDLMVYAALERRSSGLRRTSTVTLYKALREQAGQAWRRGWKRIKVAIVVLGGN